MPDNFNKELGRRVRAAREGKLTQAQLGASVGLSRTAITNIECGRQRLLVDQLVEIARATGVPPADLLPAATVAADAPAADVSVVAMPMVHQWIANVRRTAARGRS
jgi:transcriptional regulator with XRE-family HTH domain